jgi:hypothetical protein
MKAKHSYIISDIGDCVLAASVTLFWRLSTYQMNGNSILYVKTQK